MMFKVIFRRKADMDRGFGADTAAEFGERADVMTDYQMRTLVNMIISIVGDTVKQDNPTRKELLDKLRAIRDGKLDEFMDAMEKE